MKRSLPTAHFYGIVSPWERRPDCEVYHWTLESPLPKLPIPLASPDPDVVIDLAAVYATTFERGRYDRSIAYGAIPSLPLATDDLAWVRATAALAGK